jgi:hypothetical protein
MGQIARMLLFSQLGDPPPLNWSTLRYVFGHEKEDRKCR